MLIARSPDVGKRRLQHKEKSAFLLGESPKPKPKKKMFLGSAVTVKIAIFIYIYILYIHILSVPLFKSHLYRGWEYLGALVDPGDP